MDALEAFLGYIPNAPAAVTNDAEMQQLADAIQADIASSMDKDSEIAVLKAKVNTAKQATEAAAASDDDEFKMPLFSDLL